MEALFGIKSRLQANPQISRGEEGREVAGGEVPQAAGIVPWIELLIGCYFALTIWYAIDERELLHRPVSVALRVRLLVHGVASRCCRARLSAGVWARNVDESSPEALPRGRLIRHCDLNQII